jgi:hypothetical protein
VEGDRERSPEGEKVEDGRIQDGTEWTGERQPEKEGLERRPVQVEIRRGDQ